MFLSGNMTTMHQSIGILVLYVYIAYTCMILATRLGTARPWLAWIPFADMYLITQMALKPWWWLFGFFIPFANIALVAYLWSEIAKRLNQPWWIGILIAVPFVGLAVPGYLVVTTSNHGGPKKVDPIQ